MNNLYAVIMAGGSGERFWPLSTPRRPKQFVSLFGGKTLIAQAAERLEGLVPPERVLVVTARSLVAATRRALPRVPAENVVGEPMRRDTAAAVATACGLVKRRGGADAVCAILTADQLMSKPAAFRRILADAAVAAAKTDAIVTLGVTPTHPATGFGYVEPGARVKTGTRTPVFEARRFVEKPDAATAKTYVKNGFVWNAGMFIWRVAAMEQALAKHAPALAILAAAVADAAKPAGVLKKLYPQVPKISVDYAVMEKAEKVLVAAGDFGWDDVGSWSAIPNHFPADADGNAVAGAATLLDCSGVSVVGEGAPVALFGVKDLVVVSAKNAVLVCAKERVAELKKLVARLPVQ